MIELATKEFINYLYLIEIKKP